MAEEQEEQYQYIQQNDIIPSKQEENQEPHQIEQDEKQNKSEKEQEQEQQQQYELNDEEKQLNQHIEEQESVYIHEQQQQQEQQQQPEEEQQQQQLQEQKQKQESVQMPELQEQQQQQDKTPLKIPKEKQKQVEKVKITTDRSFKTLEQIYSSAKPRGHSSMQFLRTADQFDRKVVHDQINRSASKQQYTFAKAQRFSKTKESYCSIQFYDSQVTSALGKRSAALGYGIKSDFTKHDKYIPGPTTYTVQNKNTKGVKFAFGRDQTMKQGIHGNIKNTPAPNLYQIKDIKTDIKWSLGERTNAKHIYIESKTPAPGTYNVGGFNSNGSYFVKYKSSGAPMISPPSQQSIRVKRVPGPGTYDPPGDIGDRRGYLPSNYTTKMGYRFSGSERQTQIVRNKYFPGPGSYQLPSEFGDFEYPPMI